jgi:hypothetical protein
MEAIEFVFKLILGIGILLIVGYFMSFITGGISKFFGTTTTLNGKIVATPDTLDQNIRELKDLRNKFLLSYNKYRSKIVEKQSINVSEQIRLLSDLEQLKKSNAITEEEYSSLKDKIILK